jgi:hypothetical protein
LKQDNAAYVPSRKSVKGNRQESDTRLLFGDAELGIYPEPTFKNIWDRLIVCMYFALTTLATVGYGDFSPRSTPEKVLGSLIQILGVTFFSILMNSFIDVVNSL